MGRTVYPVPSVSVSLRHPSAASPATTIVDVAVVENETEHPSVMLQSLKSPCGIDGFVSHGCCVFAPVTL
jgi:hypothetical protein